MSKLDLNLSESGNVSLITAIVAPLLFLAAGLALDYARVISEKNQVQQAVDAAILASVTEATQFIEDNPGSSKWRQVAQIEFDRVLNANIDLSEISAEVQSDLNYDLSEGSITGRANYVGDIEGSLLTAVGYDKIDFTGVSEASTAATPSYIRVNFIMDVSNSMGIGATRSDQQKMLQEVNCAFACHYESAGIDQQNITPQDVRNLEQVRALGVTLRIDVAKKAAQEVVQTLEEQFTDHFRPEVGIYLFSNSLFELEPGTTLLERASRDIANLEIIGKNLQGGTNFHHSLSQFTNLAPTGGDGSSENDRRTFTILITDGIEYIVRAEENVGHFDFDVDPKGRKTNPAHNRSKQARMQLLDSLTCEPIKQANHELIVLNLEYMTDVEGASEKDMDFIRNHRNRLESEFADCASNNLFYSGRTPQDIEDALKKIQKVFSSGNSVAALTR